MKPEFAMVQRRAAASVLALLVCCGCALAEWDDLGARASCGTVQLTGAPDLLDFSFDPTANGLWVTTAGGDLRQHGLEGALLATIPASSFVEAGLPGGPAGVAWAGGNTLIVTHSTSGNSSGPQFSVLDFADATPSEPFRVVGSFPSLADGGTAFTALRGHASVLASYDLFPSPEAQTPLWHVRQDGTSSLALQSDTEAARTVRFDSIYFDPESGSLFALCVSCDGAVYEISGTGQVVGKLQLATPEAPRAIDFTPGGAVMFVASSSSVSFFCSPSDGQEAERWLSSGAALPLELAKAEVKPSGMPAPDVLFAAEGVASRSGSSAPLPAWLEDWGRPEMSRSGGSSRAAAGQWVFYPSIGWVWESGPANTPAPTPAPVQTGRWVFNFNSGQWEWQSGPVSAPAPTAAPGRPGYCSLSDSSCSSGFPQGGLGCNADEGACVLGCTGTWCPTTGFCTHAAACPTVTQVSPVCSTRESHCSALCQGRWCPYGADGQPLTPSPTQQQPQPDPFTARPTPAPTPAAGPPVSPPSGATPHPPNPNPKRGEVCLTIAPYVMGVEESSATVRWETDDKATTRLCWRPAGSSATWSADWDDDETELHAAQAVGLSPETAYEYKVLTTDLEDAWDCASHQSLSYCGGSRSSRSGGAADPPLDFACRAEYLENRERANGGDDEIFEEDEVESIATLPAACPGEEPVPLPPITRPGDPGWIDEYTRPPTGVARAAETGCSGLSLEFTTAPVPGKCGLTFRSWWLGDSGVASSDQADNRDAAMDFFGGRWDGTFALGDNAYKSGTFDEYREKFFDYYCGQFAKVGLYPILGNHDAYTAKGDKETGPYFELFKPGYPTRSSYKGSYSYQHGRVHIIMMDLSFKDWEEDDDLLDWIDEDLAAARASGQTDWILAGNHFPPYSRGSHNSDSQGVLIDVREKVVPIMDKHGVDVHLTGHSHSYERSHLINGHYEESDKLRDSHIVQEGDGKGTVYRKKRCGESGTVHVVTGSASKRSSASLNHDAHDVSIYEKCTTTIIITGNELQANCIDGDGDEVDSFKIIKDMSASCSSGSGFGPTC
eukprot:jgi/Tetstr1/443495/TSEL_031500.t1